MAEIRYVSVSYGAGGTAWANPSYGTSGDTITISYRVDNPTVSYDYMKVTRLDGSGSIYYRGSATTFVMPDCDVSVLVLFSSDGGGGGDYGTTHSVYCRIKLYNDSGQAIEPETTDEGAIASAWSVPAAGTKDTLITVSYYAYKFKNMASYVFDHMVATTTTSAVPLIGANQFLMPDANVGVDLYFKKGGSSGGGGGGGGGSGSGGDYDQPDIAGRAIPVPSIVKYYTDQGKAELLNRRYQCKEDYERAIRKYGAIYKTVNFSETSDAEQLKKFGNEWILNNYYDGVLSFSVKAVDLHMLGYDKDQLICGDQIPVEFRDYYQEPVTKTFTCLSAQVDPLHPENSTYKIGIPGVSDDPKYRLAANMVKSTAEINKAQSEDAKKAEVEEAMKILISNNNLNGNGIPLN